LPKSASVMGDPRAVHGFVNAAVAGIRRHGADK
jgi:hypothetical protein